MFVQCNTQKITGWDLVLLPHEWMQQAIFCDLKDLPQVLHAQVFWLHLLLHRLHKWRSHRYQRVTIVWTLNSCNWTLWKVMPTSHDYDLIKFLYDTDCHSITIQLTKQEPNSPKLWKNHNRAIVKEDCLGSHHISDCLQNGSEREAPPRSGTALPLWCSTLPTQNSNHPPSLPLL